MGRFDQLRGHAGNDRYLTLAQEARILLFRALGYENEANLSGKVGIIITDAAIVYKSELFLGDNLRIQISIGDINKYGFDFFYRIINQTKDKVGAILKTGLVGFDYEINKIAPIPMIFFKIEGTGLKGFLLLSFFQYLF